LEHILLDDCHSFGVELRAQACGEIAVELDGDYMPGAACERTGDGAAAGADFYHSAPGKIAEGRNDSLGGAGIDEKILPELWFVRHLLPMVDERSRGRFGVKDAIPEGLNWLRKNSKFRPRCEKIIPQRLKPEPFSWTYWHPSTSLRAGFESVPFQNSGFGELFRSL
jgi:hypothetical protein